MSKKDVEREAERLATFLMDKPLRGDRVLVMVVRNNLDEMTVEVGVETVRGHRTASPIKRRKKVVDLEKSLGGKGAISLVSERKVAAKRKVAKRRPGKLTKK